MLKTISATLGSQQLAAKVMSRTKEEEDGFQVHYCCCGKQLCYSLQKDSVLH